MRMTIVSLALLLAAGVVGAEDPKETLKDKPIKEQDFLPLALDQAMAIERFSSLADKRSGSEKVKQAAAKLRADAKEYREDLTKAAEGMKVAFLTGLKEGNQATYVRLATLTGEKFDEAYLKAVGDALINFDGLVTGQVASRVFSIAAFVKERHKSVEDHAKTIRDLQKDAAPRPEAKPKDKGR